MLSDKEIEQIAHELRPYYFEFIKSTSDESKKNTWLLFQQECEGIVPGDIQKIADKL